MKINLKSYNGIILEDKWDENEFEKDVKTVMIADYDETNENSPVYIELLDVKDNKTIGSICIAISRVQAKELAQSLNSMVINKQ